MYVDVFRLVVSGGHRCFLVQLINRTSFESVKCDFGEMSNNRLLNLSTNRG